MDVNITKMCNCQEGVKHLPLDTMFFLVKLYLKQCNTDYNIE